jgi:pimeloyl-ACP methyl ester carboxylesterase
MIPSTVAGLSMHALLYRPKGKGPFKLAVINHGSDEDARVRAAMPTPVFPALTAYLLARGYAVVVPERPGHGATGGPYLESQGACAFPDYVKSAGATADSIGAAVDYMLGQDFIRKAGVLVIGNSAGGWGALAYAARNPAAVAGVVNFSGGRGGRNRNRPNDNCAPDRLVAAAASFGRGERIPTLWLYAENDTYFGPDLSRQMATAFAAAGGRARYALLPAVRGDGHALIMTAGAEASWASPLSDFLAHDAAR